MENMLDKIILVFDDEKFRKADGYDDAVIGVAEDSRKLIYSIKNMLEIAKQQNPDLTDEEVEEYVYYNTIRAFVGPKTPIWCDDTV